MRSNQCTQEGFKTVLIPNFKGNKELIGGLNPLPLKDYLRQLFSKEDQGLHNDFLRRQNECPEFVARREMLTSHPCSHFGKEAEHRRNSRVPFSEYFCLCHLLINSPFHELIEPNDQPFASYHF